MVIFCWKTSLTTRFLGLQVSQAVTFATANRFVLNYNIAFLQGLPMGAQSCNQFGSALPILRAKQKGALFFGPPCIDSYIQLDC